MPGETKPTRPTPGTPRRSALETIVHASAAAIILEDPDGRIVTWNPAAEKIFGYPEAEAIGRPISFMIPAERADEFRCNVGRLERGERVEDYETVRLHRDGTLVDVALTLSRVLDDTGRASGLCAIYYDIRPRKEMEQRMAELLERERQRVGRELHDTLGQQLTAVGMLVSSLKAQSSRGPERLDAIARLEQTVEESKGQLRSMMAGVFPVAVDQERLTWSLHDLAHETSRIYGQACRFEDGHAAQVEDGFVATQVFLIAREAVHNAVRHARAKEIVIRLDGEDALHLSVRDDGCGLPETLDDTSTMGMRIMRYRSGLIGGRLQVESGPGGGTRVTLTRRAATRR